MATFSFSNNTSFAPRCPICNCVFDNANMNKMLPCREMHVICLQCLKQLFDAPASSKTCCLNGEKCRADRPHATCPLCNDVFHLRLDDPNLAVSVPITLEETETFNQRRRQLIQEILSESEQLRKVAHDVITSLNELKIKINTDHFNCNVARLSGAIPSVIGGIMFLVGAVLTPLTLGASSGLMLAGGVVGGAGGATAAGASIAEIVINSLTKSKIDGLVADCQNKLNSIDELYYELSVLDSIVEVNDKLWTQFGIDMADEDHRLGEIAGASRLLFKSSDILTAVLARNLKFAASSVRIFGIVSSAIMLPVDIISIVWNSYDIHKRTPAKLCSVIQEAISGIEKSCINPANNIEENLKKRIAILDNLIIQ